MSAISQAAPSIAQLLLLRSLLPQHRRLHIPDQNRRRRLQGNSSPLRLIGHLAMTSLVFLVLTTFVWLVSLALHVMHSTYPFSQDFFQLLQRLELFLAYADAGATCLILLNAIVRYVIATIRGNS